MKKIVQKLTPGPQYSASHLPLQILRYVKSRFGASFSLHGAFCGSLSQVAIPSSPEISAKIVTALSGEAL